MRLFIVPFILVGLLVQAPTSAFGNKNQEAADKIANAIGERFPDADIDVSYQGGEVWLQGEAGSQDQRKKIVEHVFSVPGVRVTEVSDEIKIMTSRTPAGIQAPAARPVTSAVNAPVPMPSPAGTGAPAANNARQTPQQQQAQRPQSFAGALLAPYPQQQYQAAYGQRPGQPSAVPAPYAPTSYVQAPQAAQQQYAQQQQQYAQQQYQPAYGPQGQMAYHPEAYGPQGPLPGQYNQPHLPDYAWPAYANYPNYAQVSYPKAYSPKAWPYIGPFYPYPQVPLSWRKVTLEHDHGWWWLDFDDGTPSGPFSGLFRQPMRYTY